MDTLSFSPIAALFGSEIANRTRDSKVLMVGAGGIGCELIKNLVLIGFGQIHMVWNLIRIIKLYLILCLYLLLSLVLI